MSQQFPDVLVFDAGLWQHGKVVRELPDGRVVVRVSSRETVTREKSDLFVKPQSRREKNRSSDEDGVRKRRLV